MSKFKYLIISKTKKIRYINKFPSHDFICGAVKKDNKIYAGFRPNDIKKQFNIIPSSIVGFYIKLESLKKVSNLSAGATGRERPGAAGTGKASILY